MAHTPPTTILSSDTTIRLSCINGDMLFWIRPKGILSGRPDVSLYDYWSLTDGSSVLITNRSVDLPDWFELHPTEVAGLLAYQVLERLDTGWQPKEPVDGPNIWRVRAGHRIVLGGKSRPGQTATEDGIIQVFDFWENALVVGEAPWSDIKDVLAFGAGVGHEPGEKEIRLGQSAMKAARHLGVPRTISTDWTLDR